MDIGPVHYRIVDTLEPTGVVIRIRKFIPIKETTAGYWVAGEYAPTWLSFDELKNRKWLKWISKTSIRRHCYPDLDMAMRSFKRRKEVQASKLRLQLEQAEAALAGFDNYKSASVADLERGGVDVGNIPSACGLLWDL